MRFQDKLNFLKPARHSPTKLADMLRKAAERSYNAQKKRLMIIVIFQSRICRLLKFRKIMLKDCAAHCRSFRKKNRPALRQNIVCQNPTSRKLLRIKIWQASSKK